MLSDYMAMAADPKTGLRAVAALLMAKVILAIIRSLKEGHFDPKRLPEFLKNDVVPYGGGIAVLWLLNLVDEALAPVYHASVLAVTGMLLKQVWQHVRYLFGAKPPSS